MNGGENAGGTELASELAYYYPEPYWLAQEGSWIKSLLLFFDGVAILLPDYMSGREIIADPTLAEPLSDQGLLKVLHPEWFVDEEMARRVADGIVELITSGAFEDDQHEFEYAALSMSRMGYVELSGSRMGNRHQGIFEMIHNDLKERGLAKDSEDGVSIPLRTDVRLAYLLLLAQEARAAGQRQGFNLQPATNMRGADALLRSFLELAPMPSRGDVVSFDLATASVDLDEVPLDEILSFRLEHGAEHRLYLLNLRKFLADVSGVEADIDRQRMVEERQSELNDAAQSLTRLAIKAFKVPSTAASFGLGLTGAAWSLVTGDPVPAVLGTLGAGALLLPSQPSGSAYSYIFRAHRQWPG